ncbi:MotA/TolQ/ExbB proton channel family protein [Candidatus Marinarcus aquaticus]|uniref:Biopolymer transporter ExbB n=1 Tax=Candidatus Marinarcus aquaticus TaxID=2044504 RepID=A0A4Q0XTU2_9BACT|nr:MotA/TolQ/ExbB proton channel family protein [Candidatus Marinarcus aquaticus]RXJ57583.1 biopolymer transporter ExbB [Candidatus Marinarcus aquaticus]
MDLMEYVEKGGIIVYILIALNIVGFTIIIWKFLTLPRKENITQTILSKLDLTKNINAQIEYEIKRLEIGLNFIKNIASVAPLLGLLGTVIGVLKAFEAISESGLGNPTIFSTGISIALITTIAGLIVAIPHHICYNYFIALLDELEIKAKNEANTQL